MTSPEAALILRPSRGLSGTLRQYVPILPSSRIAHKLAYIVGAAVPYGILFFLCRSYFDAFPDPLTFVAFMASCLMAFVVGFYFEVCVGLVGFWFLEVTSLLYIVMTLNF